MEKINFKNKGETGAVSINADNLNLLQTNVENSINSLPEEIKNGCYFKSFANTTNIAIFSCGWDVCLLISSQYISILQFQDTDVPVIKDVYGTHAFSCSVNGNTVTLSNLYSWDHYIIIGSNGVTKIE